MAARFSLAFGSNALDPAPTWTPIDTATHVTSITIDRGRSYELDQTQTGRATVQIMDPDGTLDPTNPTGPYHGQIRPMLPALICRRNPVTGAWEDRYRGYVEDYTYQVDPSQKVNQLTISLLDLFDILTSAEMQLGVNGTATNGQCVYPNQHPEERIAQILTETGVTSGYFATLGDNTRIRQTTYSPGETALAAIQEAADGDFPAVANVYVDRHGRLCFHGRQARFDPIYLASISTALWDFHHWKAGDGAAVHASPSDTAQVRALGYQRGVSKIINSAIALPAGVSDTFAADPAMHIVDTASVSMYGLRSWSLSNLLTIAGYNLEGVAVPAPTETRQFARFFVQNYAQPTERINQITFRSLNPTDVRAAANWDLLSRIDIADIVDVTAAVPGGGGFAAASYFVEGVHEDVKPAAPDYDDVTVTLDLSPRSYYATNPWIPDPATIDDPSGGVSHTNPVMRPGKRKTPIHGHEHQHTGPDPIPFQYEKVGLPAGGGAGSGLIDSTETAGDTWGVHSAGVSSDGYVLTSDGAGGSLWLPASADGGADLTGYLHYGVNPGGEVDSSGTAQIDGAVIVKGQLSVLIPSGLANCLSIAESNGQVTVTGAFALTGESIELNATSGGVYFPGDLVFMPNLPVGSVELGAGALWVDDSGFVRMTG